MDILQTPATLVPLLAGLGGLLWLAAIARRIVRLARYFQLEGYESKRYARWMLRARREQRYALGTLAVLLLLAAPVPTDFGVYEALAAGPGRGPVGVVQGIVGVALAALLLAGLPRDRQIKQPFVRTPRAMRLLVTALILGAALPVYYLAALAASYANRAPLDLLSAAFFSTMSGAIGLALAPLALPAANLLLWPVEAANRSRYMRSAKAHLKRSGATVICITGSYGKTTTKHYLHHILSARFRTLMTPKSYNTLMGISKVINETLAGDLSYEYFIVEADAYFVGENARICKLVEPHIGMVMTVGPMHLERLGSMENVAAAQYEIIAALPPEGAGIFNGDDPQVAAMCARGYPETRLMVTQRGASGARIVASGVRMMADGMHFEVEDTQTGARQAMRAPVYGETNVTNILMATAVAVHLGMSLPEIAARVATLQPAEHRMVRRVLADGTVIIDDAYSANPVGTKAALDVLALHDADRRRIVISSGMFELGAAHEAENRRLGEHMAAAATDVILIGSRQVRPVREGLLARQFPPERLHVVESLEAAIAIYRDILKPGDALLMLTDLPDTYAS